MNNARARLLGLGASLAILLLLVGTPILLVAIGATPWTADSGELGSLLTSPDDGTLAMVVVGIVAWLAWAVMTVSFAFEILALLRGIQVPHLPGLGLPQQFAGRLVAVAALLFFVAPTMAPAFAPAPSHDAAAGFPPEPDDLRLAAVATSAPAPIQPVSAASLPAADPEATTIDYTVKRGDSLWKIAEQHLGDGARYVEIVGLNEHVLGGRPDFILPGTLLRIPQEDAESYVVKPGDTLSDIALDELGDPLRYPEIFEASSDIVQPDGARLTDPDLIRPGWELTIPVPAARASSPEAEPEKQPKDATPPVEPTRQPTPTPSPVEVTPDSETASADTDHEADAASAGWLLPGLAGGGSVLAGSLLLAVRAHRRTQQRYRTPGHLIAPPPLELRAVEKTATIAGAPTAAAIGNLDRLLRHLAANASPAPLLDTVELDNRTATLHLAEPADLPEPWSGADTTWSADLDADVEDVDELWPCPMLVSVGQDDSGHLWLLNLEQFGSIALTGDASRSEALIRHVAAELALNPWSVLVHTDALGIGAELAPLDSLRFEHRAADDVEFLDHLRADLEASQQAGFGDPDPFHVLLAASDPGRTEQVRAVASSVKGQSSRSGAAVVIIGSDPEPGDAVLDLGQDGRLRVPHLGLELQAAGLTSEEASAGAAIVGLTRDAKVVPMPRSEGTTGWRALADDAGALREALTEARPLGPAGSESLLPESEERYETVAATTIEDIASLAPVVPQQTRSAVEEADPTLDDDLAEWLDSDSQLPKLTLLGPVTASARGDSREIVERKPYFVEMLAYVALHPDGVTSASVADAFSIGASRARTDISFLRAWLAANPRTGRPHLPAAKASRIYEETRVAGYQVEDVLVDLYLFRRLRARGQSRGTEGMADLEAALRLVTGEPFDHLRERGWSWLLDGERLHETAACTVVDTAHIVVTDALSRGDLARAHAAAETACRAAPYDEIARLDLVKVAEAEGHDELAELMLRDDVFNRTDDHLPPIELPERTEQVVKNHEWGRPRRPSNR